jgi:hypothetical protein
MAVGRLKLFEKKRAAGNVKSFLLESELPADNDKGNDYVFHDTMTRKDVVRLIKRIIKNVVRHDIRREVDVPT